MPKNTITEHKSHNPEAIHSNYVYLKQSTNFHQINFQLTLCIQITKKFHFIYNLLIIDINYIKS